MNDPSFIKYCCPILNGKKVGTANKNVDTNLFQFKEYKYGYSKIFGSTLLSLFD